MWSFLKTSAYLLLLLVIFSGGVEAQGGQHPLVGTSVTAAEVTTVEGKPVVLRYADRPTVLFIVSSGCSWCERNGEAIALLHGRLASKYRFVGLGMTERATTAFVARLPFPVYTIPSPTSESWRPYGLGATPSLMVIASGGRIERVWTGAIRADRQRDIEQFFGMSLPTLDDPQ